MSRVVYASTSCVRGFPSVEAQVAAYRAVGLHDIELGWAARSSAASLDDTLASEAGARFLVHNYFPQPAAPFVLNLASQDEVVLTRSLEMAEANLRFTRRLGAPFYSVHAGFLAEFTPESLGGTLQRVAVVPRAVALATFSASIARLAALAASLGVGLAIEPNVVDRRNLVEGRNDLLLLAEAREIVRFLEELAHPSVGVLVDLGHLNVTAHALGFPRSGFIDAIAGHVMGFHVHDNDGSADQHRAVAPGSWTLDVLRDARFLDRPVVIESSCPTPTDLARHHAWLLSEISAQ